MTEQGKEKLLRIVLTAVVGMLRKWFKGEKK